MVLGKILGALIGFALGITIHSTAGGLVLAALGAFVGHLYDSLHRPVEDELFDHEAASLREPEPEPAPRRPVAPPPLLPDELTPPPRTRPEIARAQFASHLCELFVEVARADGEVVGEEVRVVKQFFADDLGFGEGELETVRRSLKAAIARPADLDRTTARARRELSPAERQLLLHALYELALADGRLQRSESDAIKRVARGLEVPPDELRAIAELHLGEGRSHYARLGLDPDCSDDAIRSAFRRLASTHHPDKVAHLGPEAVEQASRRFSELKDSYEELRRLRGL